MTKTAAVCFSVALFLLSCGALTAFAQSIDGPLQVGYVTVTHETPTTEGLSVFETFGLLRGGATTQAGVISSVMTTKGALAVTANRGLSRDLGLAMVNPYNPNNGSANVTLTLKDAQGNVIATKSLTLSPLQHTSQFISQFFQDRSELQDFTGTVTFESNLPLAVVGLRFRGENFSTLPVIPLGPVTAVPPMANGAGGAGTFILPQFAVGQGWASEVVVVNYSNESHFVQVDFWGENGQPLNVTINGQTGTSFPNIQVPAGGVVVLSTRDNNGNSPF
jgi:hypothetical protein